jgi:hypothetical protein
MNILKLAKFDVGKLIFRGFFLPFLVACVLIGAVGVMYPVELKQVLTAKILTSAEINKLDDRKHFDIDDFFLDLPDNNVLNNKIIYTRLPRELYDQALIHGQGNCSNKSYGAAFLFRRDGIDYRIGVIFGDASIINTDNHTVVEVFDSSGRIRTLDLLSRILGTDSLFSMQKLDNYTPQRAFISYGNIHAESLKWLKSNFFSDAMIGYQMSNEVNRYFDYSEIFIKFYRHIFTSRKVERYVVDGSAILFGY